LITKKEYLKAQKVVMEYQESERQKKARKTIADNMLWIGKCFKYDNFYTKSGDHWWLYKKVVGTKGEGLITEEFQKTSLGIIEVKRQTAPNYLLGSGYKLITDKEYEIAKEDILKELELFRK